MAPTTATRRQARLGTRWPAAGAYFAAWFMLRTISEGAERRCPPTFILAIAAMRLVLILQLGWVRRSLGSGRAEENRDVELADVPVRDVRPLLTEERADFLTLLASFGDADWVMPTEAGRWTVKDVALHLLDDDLGWLSRGRDNDRSGLLDDTGDYRQALASTPQKERTGWSGRFLLSGESSSDRRRRGGTVRDVLGVVDGQVAVSRPRQVVVVIATAV